MYFHALMTAGILGLASGGFNGAEPIPISAGIGAQTYGDINSLPAKPQAPAGPGVFIPIHVAADFPFVTIVKDDGQGPAGGWQEAKANLPFKKFGFMKMSTWYCTLTIGVPIRHSIVGYISPAAAATMSATVTNSVAGAMAAGTDFDLPQGIFCDRFRTGVKAAFPAMYPIGVTVGL